MKHSNLIRIDAFIEATGNRDFVNVYEKTLPPPFCLTAEARGILDRELRRVVPFTVDGDALVLANDEFLVVMNNAAVPQKIAIPELDFSQILSSGEIVRLRIPFLMKYARHHFVEKSVKDVFLLLYDREIGANN